MKRIVISKRSLRARLISLIAITGTVTVLLASVLVLTRGHATERKRVRQTITSDGRMLAIHCAAPLRFQDPAAARETIEALRPVQHFGAAVIFDRTGREVARYMSPGSRPVPSLRPGPEGFEEENRWSILREAIVHQQDTLGTLVLAYDHSWMLRELASSLGWTALVALLAVGAGMLVAYPLQRAITGPVEDLVDVAGSVARGGSLSARARLFANDELGQLTRAFNEMLGRLEENEESLVRANERYDQLLAREQEARHAAEEANRTKDEFLATLSHEIRTPLAAILGWSQVLARMPAAEQDAELREGIATVERNARTQAQLVDDLLDMSRIVAGTLRLSVRSVPLREVTEAAIETVRHAAGAKGIELRRSYADENLTLRGDPGRLQQVIWNLLANAVKFTPRGGIVTIAVSADQANAVITVSDTGRGIAPDFLPHIFERFRQADASASRRFGGLGLGLSIVRNLVELHGGTVQAESPGLGQGATFTVVLPRELVVPYPRGEGEASRARTSDGAQEKAGASQLSGVRVMVVEDEADTRNFLTRLLSARGASPAGVESGEAALQLLPRFQPHVMISDIGMPGMDGYEMMRRVRALSPDRGGDVPAVALTAFARHEDRHRALEAGYNLHLPKPVDEVDLLDGIARLARPAPPSNEPRGA